MNDVRIARELVAVARELVSLNWDTAPSWVPDEPDNWIRDYLQDVGPRGVSKSRLLSTALKYEHSRSSILKALKELEADDYLTTNGGRIVWTLNPPWER